MESVSASCINGHGGALEGFAVQVLINVQTVGGRHASYNNGVWLLSSHPLLYPIRSHAVSRSALHLCTAPSKEQSSSLTKPGGVAT